MRRRAFLIALCTLVVFVFGFAYVPSVCWADDAMSEGQLVVGEQPAELEDIEVVPDDETEDEAGPDATAGTVPDEAADVLVLQDKKDEQAGEPAIVVQNSESAQALTTGESSAVAEESVPGLEAQATPTSLSALLADVTSPTVMYRTHVQSYGWQSYKANGTMSGTTGESKRLEAIQIGVKVPGVSGGIAYKVHRQTYGWEKSWITNGAVSGTTGESKRLEAIKIKLTGNLAKKYDVTYRVHVQSYGWQPWVKNGELAGTTGKSKRLEGIQIKLVAKSGAAADASVLTPIVGALVNYNALIQTDGWTATVADGTSAGTINEGKRLEAIQIKLGSDVQGGIQYRTYVQSNGWETEWKADGALSGTSGASKRLEAIRIRLTGAAAKSYDVWYRVHAQTYGWLGWATNGESAGTAGRSKRLEAIEIRLLPKGSAAPGTTLRHFIQSSLIYLDAGHGMSGDHGYDPGAGGSGYQEADLTKDLVNRVEKYTKKKYGITVYNNVDCDVYYTKRQLHAQSVGATALVSIHFNSAGASATGTESYIFAAEPGYPGVAAPRSDELQNIMHPRLVKALGLLDRGKRKAAFSLVNGVKTGIPATLMEVCFISNAQDMLTYQSKKTAVVKAIAEGLYEATQAGF